MMSDVGRSPWGALRRGVVGSLAVLASACASGCFQYIPVDPPAAPVGARVRVEVTSAATERIGGELGSGAEKRVEGRVVEMSPEGSLLLEVPIRPEDTTVGVSSRPFFSRIAFREDELVNLELKKLDRTRTAALVGGGALLAGVIVHLAFDTFGGNGEGNGPAVDEALILLFSIRW